MLVYRSTTAHVDTTGVHSLQIRSRCNVSISPNKGFFGRNGHTTIQTVHLLKSRRILHIGWIARRLVQSSCQSFRSLCFRGGRGKRWRCYIRRDLSSMQRKTAKKEAWRPKCVAPRLGYEQNQKETYYWPYLGHQNEFNFVGGISERRPTKTTHHPKFQCEATVSYTHLTLPTICSV